MISLAIASIIVIVLLTISWLGFVFGLSYALAAVGGAFRDTVDELKAEGIRRKDAQRVQDLEVFGRVLEISSELVWRPSTWRLWWHSGISLIRKDVVPHE